MAPYAHSSTFLAASTGRPAATSPDDVDMMPVDDRHNSNPDNLHHDAGTSSINLADLERTLPSSTSTTSSTMPRSNAWHSNRPFAWQPSTSPFVGATRAAPALVLRQSCKRRTRDEDIDHGSFGPSPVLPKMVRDGTRKPRRVTTEEIHSRTLEKLFRAARSPTPIANAPTCSSSLALPKPTLLLVPAACAHCHAIITSIIEGLPNESPCVASAHRHQQQQQHLAQAPSCTPGIGSSSHALSMHGAGAKCTSCDRQYCVACMRSCDRCDEPTCIECYMTLCVRRPWPTDGLLDVWSPPVENSRPCNHREIIHQARLAHSSPDLDMEREVYEDRMCLDLDHLHFASGVEGLSHSPPSNWIDSTGGVDVSIYSSARFHNGNDTAAALSPPPMILVHPPTP